MPMHSQREVQTSAAAVTGAAQDPRHAAGICAWDCHGGRRRHTQRFNIPFRTFVEASLGAVMSLPQSWAVEDAHSTGLQDPVEHFLPLRA